MDITDFLDAGRISLDHPAGSKKRVLESLGALIADAGPALTAQQVFECLLARERLGSTALGDGVALPHARVPGMRAPLAACLRLATAVDFDAPDGAAVDLGVGLLVPEESTEDHLQSLAAVATAFADGSTRDALRAAASPEEARRLIAVAARAPA